MTSADLLKLARELRGLDGEADDFEEKAKTLAAHLDGHVFTVTMGPRHGLPEG